MREIVHIQAGQCGNQIGAKVRTISAFPGGDQTPGADARFQTAQRKDGGMFVGDTRQSEASLLEIRNSPVRTVPSEGIYSISGAHSPGLPFHPVSEPLSGIIRTGRKENGCRQIGLCVTVCA